MSKPDIPLPRPFLDLNGICRALGVTTEDFRRFVKLGWAPAGIGAGKKRYWPVEDVEHVRYRIIHQGRFDGPKIDD